MQNKHSKQQIGKLNYDSKATSLYQNLRLSVRFLHLHFSNIHDSKMFVFLLSESTWRYVEESSTLWKGLLICFGAI